MSDDDDPSGCMARGAYERADGSLVAWRGYYDECGVLVVDEPEPLYGHDEDDDE